MIQYKANRRWRLLHFCCRSILLIAAYSALQANAQENDFGVWASVAVRHRITQQLSVVVEEQTRLKQNATQIDQYFTDAGIEYSITRRFKAALCYRFVNSNQQTYYSKRHRLYVDLSYKAKYGRLQFLFRTRLQQQFASINSSETGKIPEWYSRNKLTGKLDLSKKYFPYLAAEAYYLISAPNTSGNLFDKMRYIGGFEYEFNRMHALDIYYLIQNEIQVNDPVTDFVVGVGYLYTF